MQVKNCKNCGKLINYVAGPQLCPKCLKEREESFKVVKDYLYKNPGTTMNVLCAETDTSERLIKQWVREERLIFSNDSPLSIECEVCGRPIKSGRYCTKCLEDLKDSLKGVARKKETTRVIKPEDRNRMRFLDKKQE